MKLEKNDENRLALSQLITYAFNKNEDISETPVFLSRYEHADSFGTFNEGQLSSALLANHFESFFYCKKIPMAGIGSVASYPEYRGEGGIAACMTEMMADMKAQGVVISMLAPFSQVFYQRFGYEQSIWQKSYEFSSQLLDKVPSEKVGSFKRGKWSDSDFQNQVKEVYQQVAEGGNEVGTINRPDWWWHRLDQYYQKRHIVLAFDEQGVCCGYMIYRMIGEVFKVDELVYLSAFAIKKLLTFLKGHQSSFKKFIYAGPIHEKLEDYFSEQQELKIVIEPYMMSRIINFQTLLAYIPYKKDVSSLIFEVTSDEHCPWNVGQWQLRQSAGGYQVTKLVTPIDQADLAGDINSWTALILGQGTLADLLFYEKLTIKNIATLEDVFPKGKQTFYDYF